MVGERINCKWWETDAPWAAPFKLHALRELDDLEASDNRFGVGERMIVTRIKEYLE